MWLSVKKFISVYEMRLTYADGQVSGPASRIETCSICVADQVVSVEAAVADVVGKIEARLVEMTRVGHVTRMRAPACCRHNVAMVTTSNYVI